MAWVLSLVLNLIAIGLTIILVISGTENWGPSAAAAIVMGGVIFALLLGPYIILTALSFLLRRDILLSRILCVVVVILCIAGVSSLWFSIQTYLDRDPTVPGGSNWGPFLIGLALWLTTLSLFVILYPIGLIRQQRVASARRDADRHV